MHVCSLKNCFQYIEKYLKKFFRNTGQSNRDAVFNSIKMIYVHNIQIDFRRYLLNASQNDALMTCTYVLLSPVFFIVIPFIYLFIYLFKTNKLSCDYLSFLYRSFWLSNGTGRVLLDWWKFERSIRSHGTVQYFCSVQTELRNWVEFQLLSVVLPSPLAQGADLANSKWRLPAEFPRINAPTPLLYNNLHGYVHT